MPKAWYDRHSIMSSVPEHKQQLYKNIVADHKPYFMIYIYPTLHKQYREYVKRANKNCLREFDLTLDELLARSANTLTDRQLEFVQYYKRNLPVGVGECVVNRICKKIEEKFDGIVSRLSSASTFDYTIYKSGVEYSYSRMSEIRSLIKDYERRVQSYCLFAQYERIDKDEIAGELSVIEDDFRERCNKICPNSEELGDIIIDLCYKAEKSKRFAWKVCGSQIITNLANKYEKISIPVESDAGSISFDGYSGSSSSTVDSTFGIERVNPVGGNVIYNFDYYLSWMPAELAEKVQRWENAIVENDVAYSTHSMAYYTLREEESNSVLEIQRLDILIDTYTQCKNNIIETSSTDDVEKYNIIIEGHGGIPVTIEATIADTISRIDDLVADVESDKADEQANLATIRADITTEDDALELIRQSTVPSRVFTSDELAELSRYTFEGSYNDKYITITDNMTQEEQFVQFRTLYVRGTDTLKSVSKPVYKFDIDTESFQYVAGYEHWAEQLVQGCSIWVEVQPDMVVELFLSGIRVNYTDKSVKLTFGSVIDRNDLKALFEDVLGTIKKTANSVSYI